MRGRLRTAACVLALALAAGAGPARAAPAERPALEAVVIGTVARVDEPEGRVVFTDGRTVLLRPETVILADGRPVRRAQLAPGMHVAVAAVTPIVYRNGRYAVPNAGFGHDEVGGAALAWDAVWADYADRPAFQIQAP